MRHLLRLPTLVVLAVIAASLVVESQSSDFAQEVVERPIATSVFTGVALLLFTILIVDKVLADRESAGRRQSVYNVAKAVDRRFRAAIEHLFADLCALQQDEQDRVAEADELRQQRETEQGHEQRTGLASFFTKAMRSHVRQATSLVYRRRQIRGAVEARADNLEEALLVAAPTLCLSEDGEDFLQQCHDLVDRMWRVGERTSWASAVADLEDLSRDAAKLETKLEQIRPP